MEKAVQHVEALFQKADSDINHLSQRLKYEFVLQQEDVGVNPAGLMQKLGDVKKEYAAIVQQAQEIQQAQKEVVQEFQNQLTSVLTLLQDLQNHTGHEPPSLPEEFTDLVQSLGIDVPTSSSQSTGVSTGASEGASTQDSGAEDCSTYSEPVESSCSASLPPDSPRSKRKGSSEFVNITEEEFESVSSSTRGRAKLSEINSTYRILWEHFRNHKSCKSLNTPEMSKLGLKIAGQTGQAKLKVLKTLKLITMTPRGDVTGVV